MRFLLAPLFLLTLASAAQTPEVRNFTTKSNIEYTQGAHEPLKADVYIPNGEGPFPGVLFIHGGGWQNGNRYQMVKLIKDLANAGYVGFTIEYDVDPVHFPVSLNESLAALSYFREHAAEFKLDPKRVAVAGSSAGGELAALVALTPQPRATDGQPAGPALAPVQAAIIFNGVLDLTAMGDRSNMVTRYLGGPCTTLPSACDDASPVKHPHPGAPPFFVGHGTSDETVPFSQAEAFVAALRAAHVQVRFFTTNNGPHTYWLKPQFYPDTLNGVQQFLAIALHAHPAEK